MRVGHGTGLRAAWSHLFAQRQVHLMGIGGCGVSALVPFLQQAGARVSGCDLGEGRTVARLRQAGIPVALGHDPAHLAGVDVVIHTSAVPPEQAELRVARAAGLTVLTRPAALAALMTGRTTIAVSGSHGKTSTTWMIGHLLAAAGQDPTVVVGGDLQALGGGNVRAGRSDLAVLEVDESDGGFALVSPSVAVVTNLDHEHLRHYGSHDRLLATFQAWLAAMPAGGRVVVPAEGLAPGVLKGLAAQVVTCGFGCGDVAAYDLELGPEGSRCRVVAHERDLGPMQVAIPGRHMVSNALQAVAAALAVSPDIVPLTLGSCERVRRRFMVHGRPGGVRVVEDYAHHPTEISATIAAAALGGGRVHVVFQPHRHSRVIDCFAAFTACFAQAATVAMLPTYSAGEDPEPGSGGRELAEAVAARHQPADGVQFCPTVRAALAFATASARPGDTCLVLGAGDAGAAARLLLEALA